MAKVRVLYDGWPLIHRPNHPQTIHLLTLLTLAPQDSESLLALPTQNHKIDKEFLASVELLSLQEDKLGRWQQRQLPKLAEQHGAQLIHTTTDSASLFGQISTVVSPAGYGSQLAGRAEQQTRLGRALGRGGLARAHILWPSDLPAGQMPGSLHALSPVVHPAFKQASDEPPASLELPESYILYHGPGDNNSILKLLKSWTWAASSIGEYFPLLILGLEEEAKQFVEARLPEFHVEESVQLLPALAFEDLITVVQHCNALAHPAPSSAWGGAIRLALAFGKTIVAFNDPQTEALVGAAAFLVAPDDLRAFGAALISVVVDEKVTYSLEEAASKRSALWNEDEFKKRLAEIYQQLL